MSDTCPNCADAYEMLARISEQAKVWKTVIDTLNQTVLDPQSAGYRAGMVSAYQSIELALIDPDDPDRDAKIKAALGS
jgi:hypothetical protein